MTSARKIVLGILCVAGVGGVGLLQSACDLISDDGSGQTGTLQLLLTDAPFPFDVISEASVTITRVEVRLSSSGTDGTGEESSEGTADSDDGDDIGNDGPDDTDEDESGDEDGDDVGDDDTGDAPDDNGEVSDGDSGATDGDEGKLGDTDMDTAERQASQQDIDSDDDDTEDGGDAEEEEGEDDLGGELDESSDDDDDGGGSFVTIFEGEVTFNLLDLQGGVMVSLASAEISAGDYTQVRLIVSSGHVALTDGREFDLTVPSGEQTGIKLNFDFSITTNDTTTLLVDMDVSKAFVPIPGGDVNDASQIQSFIFKPSQSIRIVKIDATGSVSGVVVDESGDPVSGVTVTALRDGQEITTTATTDDGAFAMSGLEPGTYELQFSKTGFEDQSLSSLEVTTGSDTSVDDVTLSAVAAGP